jgi:quercetin dioxygenase-like cupin family protein
LINVIRHADLPGEVRGPGVVRRLTVERATGAAGITAGVVHLEPGGTIGPHTHLVEEAMTLVEGDLQILVGTETAEIRGGGASWLAPANTVHGARNIGNTTAVLIIAYPSIEVAAFPVDVDF